MTKRSWMTHSRTAAVLLPLVGLVLALGLWWLATIVFSVEAYLLPDPGDVVATFLAQPGYLLEHTWVSLVETVEGFLLSIVVGVPVALLIVRSVIVERLLYPLLLAVNAIPKIAIAPLLVVWFGFGQGPKVMMVLLVVLLPDRDLDRQRDEVHAGRAGRAAQVAERQQDPGVLQVAAAVRDAADLHRAEGRDLAGRDRVGDRRVRRRDLRPRLRDHPVRRQRRHRRWPSPR